MIKTKINNQDIQQLKKINWKILSRKGSNFELLLISIVARSLVRECYRRRGRPFGPLYISAYRQIDTHRDIPKEEFDHFTKQVKCYYKRYPAKVYNSFQAYKRILKVADDFAKKTGRLDPKSLSSSQLINLLKQYKKKMGRTIWYGYNYYFYQFLGDELFAVLREKEKDLDKVSEYFTIFSQAEELSVMQMELRDLFKLIVKLKKNKWSLEGKEGERLLERHLHKYAYMGIYYFRGHPWTIKDLQKRIRYWIKKDYLTELKKINKLEKANKKWQDYARHLQFSPQEKMLVKILKRMAYCTNYFDEVWNRANFHWRFLWKEVQKRLSISYDLLIEMDIDEIISYLEKGVRVEKTFKDELKRRKVDNLYLITTKEVYILTGRELKKYKNKIKVQTTKRKKEKLMSGQPASIGKAKGKAKIVLSVKDLSKVKKGDIMVARATVPSFVPAMERAAAIITEMGGLLSHAAIVARELHKPCVVGIENLLDKIEDGSQVEVDATKGVVKILSSK